MKAQRFFKFFKRPYSNGNPPGKTDECEAINPVKMAAIEKFKQKSVSVAVLGTQSPAGEVLSGLLKQNPLVSHLYLHGEQAKALAADLRDMDTRTLVSGYGDQEVDNAIKRAELIIMMGLDQGEDLKMKPEARFRLECDRVIELTKLCTMYAPKSIICVCVPPLSISLPVVSGIFRKTHWYSPARIIGSVAFHQAKLCSMLAQYYGLDPSGIHVPIVGGPDVDCLVPLFSRATPLGTTLSEAEMLTKNFKGLKQSDSVTTELLTVMYETAPLSQGFAINRLITTIALGLLGDQNAHTLGFIRSNSVSTCKYIVATLKMGSGGVYHNYGIPTLTGLELNLLEQAVLTLKERDEYAQCVIESSEFANRSQKDKCSLVN